MAVASDLEKLRAFEEELKSADGVTVERLQRWLAEFYSGERSQSDLDDYRVGKRPWKKLREEISPVRKFLVSQSFSGRVRFPLDSDFPDCWYTDGNGEWQGIEVTISLGRADFESKRQLVEEGSSGGAIEFIPNRSPQSAFDEARARARAMFSPEEWVNANYDGIRQSLLNKLDSKYSGMWLLIAVRMAAMRDDC